jgi:hypothetical protein
MTVRLRRLMPRIRPHSGPLGERFDWLRAEANVTGTGNGKGDIHRIPLRELGLGGH